MNAVVVSVVIPALNEERVIGSCLQALTNQTCPGTFEVIVVDNGSSDGTIAVVRQFGRDLNIRILEKKNASISALRNVGARAARADFLAFLDADCIPQADWIKLGATLLRSGRFGVIGAHYTIPPDSSWVARTWYGRMASHKRGPVSYVPAGDLFISRELFLRIGGFDETLNTSEDCELCQRVAASGRPVFGEPALSVVHLGTPQTVSAFFKKQRWHGTSVHRIFFRDVRQARSVKSMAFTLYMFTCACGAVAGVALAVWLKSLAPLLAAAPILIGPAILAAGGAIMRKKLSAFLPLAALSLVYGLARAASLLSFQPVRPDKRPGLGQQNAVQINATPVENR
jgi:glycosyltransferase involved in cell wall biosynthesis